MRWIFTWALLLFFISVCHSQFLDTLAPGRMVDGGGFKLHLLQSGEKHCGNAPTVVFFHGAGDVALHWNLVLPKVGKFACALAIDQNGEAWSEHGHNKSLPQTVFDTYTALQNAGYPAPYLLVGHSLGATQALLFAKFYRDQTAGLVLVDGTHPDVVLKVFDKEKKQAFWKRFRERASRDIPEIIEQDLAEKPQLSYAKIKRDFGDQLKPFSKKDQALFHWLYNERPFTYVKAKGYDYSAEVFQEIYTHPDSYHLGDLPLIVLSGIKKDPPEGDQYWSSDALVKHRGALQKDWLRFSNNSQQILAEKSGHHIHIDEPKLVAKAIKKMCKQIRK